MRRSAIAPYARFEATGTWIGDELPVALNTAPSSIGR